MPSFASVWFSSLAWLATHSLTHPLAYHLYFAGSLAIRLSNQFAIDLMILAFDWLELVLSATTRVKKSTTTTTCFPLRRAALQLASSQLPKNFRHQSLGQRYKQASERWTCDEMRARLILIQHRCHSIRLLVAPNGSGG